MDRRKAIRNTGALTGGAVILPSLLTLLQSCKSEPRLDWQPAFFDVKEARLISSLLDTILPTTDTPGALDVKSDMFLDKIFAKTYSEDAQQELRAEMSKFNADCKASHGADFADLSDEDKASVLKKEEASGGKFSGSVWGGAVGKQEVIGFYRSIKSMAIWAYMSSEEIGKNVLNYDPIPAAFNGCIPLAEVGNKWTF